jgi:hypothetical protein
MNIESHARNQALTLLLLVAFGMSILLASCASIRSSEPTPPVQAGIVRPQWRVGDRWVHAWTAGKEKGVKTSEVVEVREVRGVQYYVLRVDAVDRFYTMDLHWAAGIVDSKVAARAVPPEPWFNWPLEAGKRWDYQGVYEEKDRKDRMRETYRIEGVEQVAVPAGTFRAFKLVREVGSTIADQYWYAPDVRWYVKWVGRRGLDEFQEVLQQYVPAPQTAAPAASGPNAPK